MRTNGIITAVLAVLAAGSVASAEGGKTGYFDRQEPAMLQAGDITADLDTEKSDGSTEAIKGLLRESGAGEANTGAKLKADAVPVPAAKIISVVPARKFVMEKMSDAETQLFLQRIGRAAAEHCWHTAPSTVGGQTCWQVCCEYPTSDSDSSQTCYDDCSDANTQDADKAATGLRKAARTKQG